ncbi:MAG: hypothetical protein ACLU9S_18715 [Oscillospiraceae bacterium]
MTWTPFCLLLGLFLVIGGITEQGVIDQLASLIAKLRRGATSL